MVEKIMAAAGATAQAQTGLAGQVKALEGHAIKTEGRLDRIDDTLRAHGAQMSGLDGKMDTLIQAVSVQSARPHFEWREAVSTVRDVLAVCSILAGLALWFVVTMAQRDTDVQNAELKHQRELNGVYRDMIGLRIDRLSDRLTVIPKTSGSTPQ
jgi:hypothetical protein